MKRLLLPLMAISIALTSCSRDNDDITNPIENPIENPINTETFLTKIESIDSQNTINITYDGDKIVKWGDDEFVYTGDLITLRTDQGVGRRYFYNPDGTLKMTIIDLRGISTAPSYAIYYTYNQDYDDIVEMEAYTVDLENYPSYLGDIDVSQLEKLHKIFEGTYTMRNGNIYKSKTISYDIYDGSYSVSNRTYNYDDKNNPSNNIKGLSAIVVDTYISNGFNNQFEIVRAGLHNNIISASTQTIHFLPNNTVDFEENYYQVYEYEYNDKGYPISSSILGKKIRFTYQ